MSGNKPGQADGPWRPHWSDAIWILVLPVAYCFFLIGGVAPAIISAVVTVFIVIGVRNAAYASRNQHHSQRNSDKGFWNR
jgi:hypothetical protein